VDLPVLPHDSVTGGKFNPPNKLRNSCKSICAKQADAIGSASLVRTMIDIEKSPRLWFQHKRPFRDFPG
jgi:hypothetical protein